MGGLKTVMHTVVAEIPRTRVRKEGDGRGRARRLELDCGVRDCDADGEGRVCPSCEAREDCDGGRNQLFQSHVECAPRADGTRRLRNKRHNEDRRMKTSRVTYGLLAI